MSEVTIGKLNLMSVPTFNEEVMAAPIVGVSTDSPLSSTRKVIGTEVYGPGSTVTIIVNVKRAADGSVRFHKDRNGNDYAWADIKIVELPVVTERLIVSTVGFKKDSAVKLNRDSEDFLALNWMGTFAPVHTMSNRSMIIHNHGFKEVFSNATFSKFSVLKKPKKYTGGPLSEAMEGFRIAVYKKEDGIEITTSLPMTKARVCTRCKSIKTQFAMGVSTCGECGNMVEGQFKEEWVQKYTGYKGFLAERMIPAIEYAFIMESRIVPKKRACSASCNNCSQCHVRVYGQNQEEPAVSCGLGIREEMSFDFHWEQDLRDFVSLGSGIYFMHSEAVDDITCLPASPIHMKSATASNRGRVGYELPSWFSSTFKANEVLLELSTAYMRDMTKGLSKLEAMIAVADFMDNYVVELPGNIFDEEDESVELAFSRFDGSNVFEVRSEQDVLPEMDRVIQLMARVHPVIANMMMEGSMASTEINDLRETRQVWQNLMLGESSPRMIKACSSTDYMADEFDRSGEPCLWFSYKNSRKQSYSLAGLLAKDALADLIAAEEPAIEYATPANTDEVPDYVYEQTGF